MDGPALVAGLRGLHLLALLAALGTFGFLVLVAPAARSGAAAARFRGQVRRLGRRALWAALASLLLWLPVQAAAMIGSAAPETVLARLPDLLVATGFGRALAARAALLFAAALLAGGGRWRDRTALALTVAAAALQGLMGHAAAAETLWLPLWLILHVLAAGLWLGALPPLWLLLRRLPEAAGAACRRFSRLGIACVAVLVATGLPQGRELVGGAAALVGTPYGLLALAKALLLLPLLMLAGINRFRLTPALDGPAGGRARRTFGLTIGLEVALGLAIVILAGTLAIRPPGAHEQPVWPFALRLDPAGLADSFVRRRLIEAGLLLGGAVLAALAALAWRRIRWPALALAVAAAFAATLPLPRHALYTMPAYPTSFQAAPGGFTADALVRGAGAFQQQCAACHGAEGRGRGPLAAEQPVWPPDLTAFYFDRFPDGELYWRIAAGVTDRAGNPTMAGFAGRLEPERLWDVVLYMRAIAAGRSVGESPAGEWATPTAAPRSRRTCPADTPADALFRIVALGDGEAPAGPSVAADPGAGPLLTVLLSRRPVSAPPGVCTIAGEAAWQAFALVAGLPPGGLPGAEFLVDDDGWLRRLWRPGTPPTIGDLAAAAIRARNEPLAANHH